MSLRPFIVTPLFLVGLAATVQVTENRSVRSTLHPGSALVSVPTPTTAITPKRPSPRTEDTDLIDLYGNEVSDAVATYKVDATGTPYETHSPQTEVPRLPPPRS